MERTVRPGRDLEPLTEHDDVVQLRVGGWEEERDAARFETHGSLGRVLRREGGAVDAGAVVEVAALGT